MVVHIKTIEVQLQLLNKLLQLGPHLVHHPSNLMVDENRNVEFIINILDIIDIINNIDIINIIDITNIFYKF